MGLNYSTVWWRLMTKKKTKKTTCIQCGRSPRSCITTNTPIPGNQFNSISISLLSIQSISI
jgi:hypothetical protein